MFSTSTLYVDVSVTWDSNYQTGIQKVIRQLAAVWGAQNFNCQLVIYRNGQYELLPESAFQEILLVDKEIHSKKLIRQKIQDKARPLYRGILLQISPNTRNNILNSKVIRKFRHFLKPKTTAIENQVFNPKGSHLLILDLFFDVDHADYIIELTKNKKINLTFFSCDLIPINHQEFCSFDLAFYFKKFVEIAKFSNNLWSISNTTKKELDAYVGNSTYLSQSAYKWLPPSIYSLCEHNLPFEIFEEKNYLLFVSSFEPRKNHVGFFQAIRNLRKMGVDVPKIILVGGNAWDDDPITRGILDLQSEGFDLVKLTNIDECCVGKLYENALLSVYPSFFEGFGLPIVESLSLGIPVLTSNIGSTGELLKLPGTLGFSLEDPNDLTKQLSSFLTDKELQQKLRKDAVTGRNELGTWAEYATELYAFATRE